MLDHVSLRVADFAKASAFYEHALEPLGLTCLMGGADYAGFGKTRPFFWIGRGEPGYAHVAFAAGSPAAVDAFYRAALEAGGVDNGPPGLRPQYHPNYYAAFVIAPDGANIEAVCHAAE